tara:strand:+ start:755401 stop:756063 length:663 start_codon:yes stop_codon:yes gene_type:complete
MSKIKIFCEGVTDQIFISDCIEIIFEYQSSRVHKDINGKNKLEVIINNDIEVIEVGGCSNLSNAIYLAMLEDNLELGGRNIIIFDADEKEKPNGNKGFVNCKNKLEQLRKNKSIDFDFYIWPNHKDDGIIEHLLRNLIPEDREPVFDCIESHQECLKKLPFNDIKLSQLKDKVSHYLYTCSQNSTPSKRNYKNLSLWNLRDSTHIDYIKFREFLTKMILD